MPQKAIRSFLSDHPRLLGALFLTAVLLAQATPAVAICSNYCSGP